MVRNMRSAHEETRGFADDMRSKNRLQNRYVKLAVRVHDISEEVPGFRIEWLKREAGAG